MMCPYLVQTAFRTVSTSATYNDDNLQTHYSEFVSEKVLEYANNLLGGNK